MLVLGIESSCDETSIALVEDGRSIRSLVVASQTEIHARFAGVVPEVASRAHTEAIVPVAREALEKAGLDPNLRAAGVDLIAVSTRPGLTGSLAVGLSFAKGLSLATGLPITAVDHIAAHAYAVQLELEVAYPYIVLLVSGGHTMVGVCTGPGTVEVLGSTIDDACGEVFDKVSAHLGLGYPGGPAIEALAADGDADAAVFPVPHLKPPNSMLDFSFSGLKTAVVHQRERFWRAGAPVNEANIAAAFQAAAVRQLVDRVGRAVEITGIPRVVLGGGVAANGALRRELAKQAGVELALPSVTLCVDNAAMVAGLGSHLFEQSGPSPLSVGVQARVTAFRGGGQSPAPAP